jgi:predicted amidophosphoribosyltransferase
MSEKLFRIYKKFYVDEVKSHALLCGDLTANCSKCNAMGLKLDSTVCPECKTPFKYVTFRSLTGNMPKILRIIDQHPGMCVLDYDDYKKATGALRAEDLFKD